MQTTRPLFLQMHIEHTMFLDCFKHPAYINSISLIIILRKLHSLFTANYLSLTKSLHALKNCWFTLSALCFPIQSLLLNSHMGYFSILMIMTLSNNSTVLIILPLHHKLLLNFFPLGHEAQRKGKRKDW